MRISDIDVGASLGAAGEIVNVARAFQSDAWFSALERRRDVNGMALCWREFSGFPRWPL